jgi:leucyl/phenylalanyl-tRNA---protein transferase
MPIYSIHNNSLWFPPVQHAEEDGLLAIGGQITSERIEAAYKQGIFPWYNDDVPLWWCPNPRFVLYPHELNISKSTQQIIKKGIFTFKYNTDFEKIIHYCKTVYRKDQDGTWLNNTIEKVYTSLFYQQKAICAGAYNANGALAGGLYGIKLGNIFFGESMFSLEPNASKFAFTMLVTQLKQEGIVLIDCQVHTSYLESLGARFIDRDAFIKILQENIS